jgi:hypothetical protein
MKKNITKGLMLTAMISLLPTTAWAMLGFYNNLGGVQGVGYQPPVNMQTVNPQNLGVPYSYQPNTYVGGVPMYNNNQIVPQGFSSASPNQNYANLYYPGYGLMNAKQFAIIEGLQDEQKELSRQVSDITKSYNDLGEAYKALQVELDESKEARDKKSGNCRKLTAHLKKLYDATGYTYGEDDKKSVEKNLEETRRELNELYSSSSIDYNEYGPFYSENIKAVTNVSTLIDQYNDLHSSDLFCRLLLDLREMGSKRTEDALGEYMRASDEKGVALTTLQTESNKLQELYNRSREERDKLTTQLHGIKVELAEVRSQCGSQNKELEALKCAYEQSLLKNANLEKTNAELVNKEVALVYQAGDLAREWERLHKGVVEANATKKRTCRSSPNRKRVGKFLSKKNANFGSQLPKSNKVTLKKSNEVTPKKSNEVTPKNLNHVPKKKFLAKKK